VNSIDRSAFGTLVSNGSNN